MNQKHEPYVYQRTENGVTAIVSRADGIAELNAAQMGVTKRNVKTMSSISRSDYAIEYKDGRKVRLILVANPELSVPEQVAPKPVDRTALIYKRQSGDVMGRVVTVKGKDYVLAELTPANRPVPAYAAKNWKPIAYVTYWSVRDGKRFGATRTAGPEARYGTVGHTLYHNAMDRANARLCRGCGELNSNGRGHVTDQGIGECV